MERKEKLIQMMNYKEKNTPKILNKTDRSYTQEEELTNSKSIDKIIAPPLLNF